MIGILEDLTPQKNENETFDKIGSENLKENKFDQTIIESKHDIFWIIKELSNEAHLKLVYNSVLKLNQQQFNNLIKSNTENEMLNLNNSEDIPNELKEILEESIKENIEVNDDYTSFFSYLNDFKDSVFNDENVKSDINEKIDFFVEKADNYYQDMRKKYFKFTRNPYVVENLDYINNKFNVDLFSKQNDFESSILSAEKYLRKNISSFELIKSRSKYYGGPLRLSKINHYQNRDFKFYVNQTLRNKSKKTSIFIFK